MNLKNVKRLHITLYDLVMNFHEIMINNNAEHFTVGNSKTPYWYITDVRQDGTYPCHPTDGKGNPFYPRYFDYLTKVTIHFKAAIQNTK